MSVIKGTSAIFEVLGKNEMFKKEAAAAAAEANYRYA